MNISDAAAAGAFRQLAANLQHRADAQNVDLMGLAGFCRNSDWLQEAAGEAGEPIGKDEARAAVYGMSYEEWRRLHQAPATPGQLERMAASTSKNQGRRWQS